MRKKGSIFYTIYNSKHEASDHKLKCVGFIGKLQEFSVITKGKSKNFKILKLKKENSFITFVFNKNKIYENDVILCNSSEYSKPFSMSFKLMETFINIFIKDGFMVEMEGQI